MKREGQENNKKTSRSDGIYVPLDLTVEILSKLPGKSLVRFQCVSKLWLSLISKSIMTKPRLLILFDQPLLEFSVFSLSGHHLNTYKEYVYVKLDCHESDPGGRRYDKRVLYYDKSYQYYRGLICRLLRWGQFAISNPTVQQTLLLPEIKPFIPCSYMDTFFGYDPIENQYKVMCMIRLPVLHTLYKIFVLGDPKKQWRNIQGFEQSFSPKSNRVSINGKIFFTAAIGIKPGNIPLPNSLGTVLLSFDVRSERFDHHGLFPNQLRNMTLVNYQGKLGYMSYNNDSLEMWIMDDHTEKQEWSKYFVSSPPLLKNLGLNITRIVGVTINGEIVIMPKSLCKHNAQMSYVDYYDPKQKKTRRVEFRSIEEMKYSEVIFSIPDYVENTKSLLH